MAKCFLSVLRTNIQPRMTRDKLKLSVNISWPEVKLFSHMNANFDFQVLFALVQLLGLRGSVSLQQLQQPTTQHMQQHSMAQHLAQLEPMTRLSTQQLHMPQVSKSIQVTRPGHLVPQRQGTPVGDMIILMEQQERSDIQVCRQFRVRRFWMHNDGKRMRQFLYYNIMFDNWSTYSLRNFREGSQDKWHRTIDLTILLTLGLQWRGWFSKKVD